ncbi:MAG: glycerol-3-phosphate dehydrogenase/oxidase [SAR324 cluster bacterium]|nr:glycerol-3-phosphate dehydrogenase/oxidase [SAR324 cluster bacterium]MBL7006711.1 glycerol-3-phosphate dehydrogenase/oxidase [Spirochaetia bacterium]
MNLRESNIEKLKNRTFDVLIIGGGINGAVSATALAAQGAQVALVDKGDFSGFTSQNSSNLVWGGIKYMETFEFPLVSQLCTSRNLLLQSYPSAIKEIRFYTNLDKGFRFSSWMLYMGALLYWGMGSFFTCSPRLLSPKKINEEEPVINTDNSIGGFEYSDAFLYDNDSRFVFNFIRSAINYNCTAVNYMESVGRDRNSAGNWETELRNTRNGEEFKIRSKVIINACGPYVDQQNLLTSQATAHRHVFSKGIHLIVPRITKNERVLTFFADDGRLFFAIPMGHRTMVGTTDTRVDSPESEVTSEDREFVLKNINKRLNLAKPITKADIISERCGVRPLVVEAGEKNNKNEEWMKLSRKHAIDVNREQKHISIFGGKLTDCINIGEAICETVQQLGVTLPEQKDKWYGEPDDVIRDEYLHQVHLMNLDALTSPGSSEELSSRLWRRYGAQAIGLLENIREDPKMAEPLIEGTDYIRCELIQAARREMIVTLEDFLRRRSKLSLVVRHEDLKKSQGLKDACEILFGEDAQKRWDEYFA